MKYNLKEIMKTAWTIVKKWGKSIAEALKMSWKIAKGIAWLKETDREPEGRVTFNLWSAGNHARAYYKCSWRSKYQDSKGYFFDLAE